MLQRLTACLGAEAIYHPARPLVIVAQTAQALNPLQAQCGYQDWLAECCILLFPSSTLQAPARTETQPLQEYSLLNVINPTIYHFIELLATFASQSYYDRRPTGSIYRQQEKRTESARRRNPVNFAAS
jgi:hypothetical protein